MCFTVLGLIGTGCGRLADTGWHQEAGYRWQALDVPHRGTPGFTLLDPSRTGITFANVVSDSLLLQNRLLAQGGGVCIGDMDGDGRSDVFLARTDGPNALYRNLGGWRFEDIALEAGVAASDRRSTGCAFADVNGDSYLDLVLTALGGPDAIFLNDGSGRFTEQALVTGAEPRPPGSTTVTLADVDGRERSLTRSSRKLYRASRQLSGPFALRQVARMAAPSTRRFTTAEWQHRLLLCVSGLLVFETLTGLSIYLLPFSVTNQVAVVLHTVVGLVFVVPYAWYQLRHWRLYRALPMTHVMLTGYFSLVAGVAVTVSGLVLTAQALLWTRISYAWDLVHIVATFALIASALPHVLSLVYLSFRGRKEEFIQLRAAPKQLGWNSPGMLCTSHETCAGSLRKRCTSVAVGGAAI